MELNANRESQAEHFGQVQQLKALGEYSSTSGMGGMLGQYEYNSNPGTCPYCHRCPTCGRGGWGYQPGIVYCNSHAAQTQPTAGYQITYAVN